MLLKIAGFEFRYVMRNPLVWLTGILTFVLFIVGMSVPGVELGSEGGLLENGAYATLRNFMVLSVIFMFVSTSFVANAVIRDDETGFGPIMRSTPITKFQYVIGRFLGAFAVPAVGILLVPLGIFVGTMMPWADPTQLAPNRLVVHLYAYFLLALPNLFIHSAILFALATITRSMMATYLGVVVFVSDFFILRDAFSNAPKLATVVALADPFAGRAVGDAARYWTVPQRDTLLPDFSGALLYNRILWISVAAVFLAIAYAAYRYADRGISKREQKKQKVAQQVLSEAPAATMVPALPAPRHDRAAAWALLWMRARFEVKQVLMSPAFPVLLLWGLSTTFFALSTQRDPAGRPRFPTTLLLIPQIENSFGVVLLVIAVYYAGELVWRERDRRMHEIIDATAVPNWAYVVPKTLGMMLVLISALLTNVVAATALQLTNGYTHLELGKYLLWYVLPVAWDMLLIAALAVFVQALSPHKAVGWAVMVLFLIWKEFNAHIEHKLLDFGGKPPMPLSDLNGAASFWIGTWTFRVYWGAFALLLLLAAHLLWRRGTEIRLLPRIVHARRRLAGSAGWVAAAILAVFAGSGAYAFYNTNILHEYRTNDEANARAVEFEKKYWKYFGLPQPVLADVELSVDLHPEERKAVTKGRYVLLNRTAGPIAEIHVRVPASELELTKADLAGGRLITDDRKFGYRIYRLDTPMQPGEERVLTFETLRWSRGFPNGAPNTSLVDNGTFLHSDEVMPVIGMSYAGTLFDPETRREYGLPERTRPKLEDVSATQKVAPGREWTKADITIATSADQTPLAPGKKVSDVTRGGRRIARFVSEKPMHPRFSIQSARYAEKHRRHGRVDLAVYYHPAHPWNIDRMLDAMEASLDYYQKSFGPYPFESLRIIEAPGYNNRAEAFAGSIAYSETYGFLSDMRKSDTLDHVSGTTAHELAHQYWGEQVTGADMEGQTVLNETLAQYSAMMVMTKMRGEDQIRRHLQYEVNQYLNGRAWGALEEPALARVEGQSWVCYHKGSLAMYLLQKRLGEDAVNRALRRVLERFRFRGAPYPRSLDVVDALRAEAKTSEEQNLITDLFERVTLYDLRVGDATAVRRPDRKWDVTVPVEAKKFYADAKGVERETALDEHIEVGLFTAEPGLAAFDASNVLLMERQPIHAGQQVLRFVTAARPAFAGVDPYNVYIDSHPGDNVGEVH